MECVVTRLMLGLSLLFVPFAVSALQAPDVTPMLKRLEEACPGYASTYPYTQLKQLQSESDPKDWKLQMALSELDWTQFAQGPACKSAMLRNTIEGMDFVLAHVPASSGWTHLARRDGAAARLVYAVTADPADKAAILAKADAMMRQYIDGQTDPKDLRASMAHYFAAHEYIKAAAQAGSGADADALLARALEIAREGFNKAQDKHEITEPLGIALGEQAKRLPRGSAAYQAKVRDSRALFESLRGVDSLAPYNVAVDDVLLAEYDQARSELKGMGAAGTIDDQVCSGLVADSDLAALRNDDMAWFRDFVRDHCGTFLRRVATRLHPPAAGSAPIRPPYRPGVAPAATPAR